MRLRMFKTVLDEYVSRHHGEHGRREVALSLAIALTLASGALVGVAWAAGFGEVATGVVHPHWHWFLLALAGLVASLIGYTFAYRELARGDEGPDLAVHHAGALVTTGFGVFIPRGGFALDHEALLDAASRSERRTCACAASVCSSTRSLRPAPSAPRWSSSSTASPTT